MSKVNDGPVPVSKRYVSVMARGYDPAFERWVVRDFKHFGIEQLGAGYDFTWRDVGGLAPTVEAAKAAREYFKLFYGIKAVCLDYYDYMIR